MSSSSQKSPFHQTLLEVSAAAGDSQPGADQARTAAAAADIEEPDDVALSTEKLGRIQFSVSYDFDEQTLTVKIVKAEGLAAKDLSGTSDPYVKISLLPDKKHTLSTNIKRKNLNPRWNEVFAFEGKSTALYYYLVRTRAPLGTHFEHLILSFRPIFLCPLFTGPCSQHNTTRQR